MTSLFEGEEYSTVINERVLELSVSVSSGSDGRPRGNGDVAQCPEVECEGAAGPGVASSVPPPRVENRQTHIGAVLGTGSALFVKVAPEGHDKCAAVLSAHQTVVGVPTTV